MAPFVGVQLSQSKVQSKARGGVGGGDREVALVTSGHSQTAPLSFLVTEFWFLPPPCAPLGRTKQTLGRKDTDRERV